MPPRSSMPARAFGGVRPSHIRPRRTQQRLDLPNNEVEFCDQSCEVCLRSCACRGLCRMHVLFLQPLFLPLWVCRPWPCGPVGVPVSVPVDVLAVPAMAPVVATLVSQLLSQWRPNGVPAGVPAAAPALERDQRFFCAHSTCPNVLECMLVCECMLVRGCALVILSPILLKTQWFPSLPEPPHHPKGGRVGMCTCAPHRPHQCVCPRSRRDAACPSSVLPTTSFSTSATGNNTESASLVNAMSTRPCNATFTLVRRWNLGASTTGRNARMTAACTETWWSGQLKPMFTSALINTWATAVREVPTSASASHATTCGCAKAELQGAGGGCDRAGVQGPPGHRSGARTCCVRAHRALRYATRTHSCGREPGGPPLRRPAPRKTFAALAHARSGRGPGGAGWGADPRVLRCRLSTGGTRGCGPKPSATASTSRRRRSWTTRRGAPLAESTHVPPVQAMRTRAPAPCETPPLRERASTTGGAMGPGAMHPARQRAPPPLRGGRGMLSPDHFNRMRDRPHMRAL